MRSKSLPLQSILPAGLAFLLLVGISECGTSDADGDGWTTEDGDCHDEDAAIHPGGTEHCNGLDDDCDSLIDEAFSKQFFRDEDADGFGTAEDVRCEATDGYIAVRGDCDDEDRDVHAGAFDPHDDGIDQDCGGSDGPQPSLGLPGSAAAELQAALDAASAADTIWVGPGTWRALELNLYGKDVSLISTHFASETILDAQGQGRVMSIVSGESVQTLIDGFTLMGGRLQDQNGAGILIENSSPRIERCVIRGNSTVSTDPLRYPDGGLGGGIALFSSDAILSQIAIEQNSTQQTWIYYCSSYCTYYVAGGRGAGLYAAGGELQLSHLTVAENRALPIPEAEDEKDCGTVGGGIALEQGIATLKASAVSRNEAYLGAGLALYDQQLTISDAQFLDNQGQTVAQVGGGGGIYASDSVLHAQRIEVRNNTRFTPGGIYLVNADSTFEDSRIMQNVGIGISGGIVATSYVYSPLRLHHVIVQDNHGVGLGLLMVDSEILQSTIIQNRGRYGGGTYIDSAIVRFENSLVTHNVGYNVYNLPHFPGTVEVVNSSFFSSTGPSENLSTLGSPITWLTEDPRYVRLSNDLDSSNDDLHLRPDSPVRGSAIPGILDPDATPTEQGAYGGADGDTAYYQDIDQDGLYDGWELLYWSTPQAVDGSSDLDGDGLTQLQELLHSTHPMVPDTDGDGYTDATEVLENSSPSDWYARPASSPGLDEAGFFTARVPEDFVSISSAINAIQTRGTVHVATGEWPDQLVVAGKSVQVTGPAGSTQTLVTSVRDGSVMQALWSELVVQGITMQGGSGWLGGNVSLTESNSRLRDVILRDGRAYAGGGLFLERGSTVIEHSAIESNIARNTGGGIDSTAGVIEVRDTDIVGNVSRYVGGGWYTAVQGDYTLDSVRFLANHSARAGGMRTSSAEEELEPLTMLQNVAFQGNSADEDGGCLYGNGRLVGENLTFVGCSAGEDGGALYTDAGEHTFSHVTAVLNHADSGSAGIAIPANRSTSLTITDSILAYNDGFNLYLMPDGEASLPTVSVVGTSLYNPSGTPSHNIPGPPSAIWSLEPGFLQSDEAGLPTSLHLAATSSLLNIGVESDPDADGSQSDLGCYGGPGGTLWDNDRDCFPDWFWPGSHSNPPPGFGSDDFDLDDENFAVQ